MKTKRIGMTGLGIFLVCSTLLATPVMAQRYESVIREKSLKLVNAMKHLVDVHLKLLEGLTEEVAAEIGDDAIELRRKVIEFVRLAFDTQARIENEWTRFRYARTTAEYNRWVEWQNSSAKTVNTAMEYAARQDFRKHFLEIFARYEQAKELELNRAQQYLDWMWDRVGEIARSQERVLQDPAFLEIVGYPIDAIMEIQDAYAEYARRLLADAEVWSGLIERFVARSNAQGAASGINDLLDHFRYTGSRQPGDTAHRFLQQKLDTPLTFSPPDVSEPLDRYRKAYSILEHLEETLTRIETFQMPISPDDATFEIMVNMADILEITSEEHGPLYRFAQANAEYAESIRILPDLNRYKTSDEDVFVAAQLIAAEEDLRTFFDRLVLLHDEVTGRLFQDVKSLRAQWVNAYLLCLKSEIESNIMRMRDFEVHLLEGNVSTGFTDMEALLATLQAQLRNEQEGLKLLHVAAASERTRYIETLKEWTISFEDIPVGDRAESRLDTIIHKLLDFEGLPSADPSLYLARCELALSLFPGNVSIRHEKAFQLIRLGRYVEAEAILLDLYTAEPFRQDLAVTLASSYERQGNLEAAEALFREMMADTQIVEIQTVEAWLRFAHRQGNLDRATPGLEAVFEAREELDAFYRMLVAVYTYTGDWRAATRVFELLPDSKKTTQDWQNYVALGLSSEDVYTRALLAISEDTDASGHQISMAGARIGQGRIEEARDLLEGVGLENTPWYLLIPWLHLAEKTESEDLSDRVGTVIDAIEGTEERDLMRAYRLVASQQYGAAASLLVPYYEWSAYPYLRFLRARAAAGLDDRETALAILDKLDVEMGFDFWPAIAMKFQLQVLMGERAQARTTLDRMGGAGSPECPILSFHQCLYETRFGTRKEAMRMKNDVLAAYPNGLAEVSMAWHIIPESITLFGRAGTVPVKLWVLIGGGVFLFCLLAVLFLRAGSARVRKGRLESK